VNPGQGLITDDTQMTLFTLEGLVRAHVADRSGAPAGDAMQNAYQRWLHTQGVPWERAGGRFAASAPKPDGWLIGEPGLFHQRAPGGTCLSALRAFAAGGEPGSFSHALNDSKGCGGVMRAAPAALWSADLHEVCTIGAAAAALTHSHPSGYLSAGALAVIVRALLDGSALREAIALARQEIQRWDGHSEQLRALDAAVGLADRGRPSPEDIEAELGGGWVGEEALAIAVCVALAADDLADGLLLAVNHSGDSDSTGAICGNILGALHGADALPADWLAALELREVTETLVADALAEFSDTPPELTNEWLRRYPPL
jgi:ADP-ribosyl-[dinitrogen reductase] hydrolase